MGTLAESFLADLEDLSDASASDREEEKNDEDDVEVNCPYPTPHFAPGKAKMLRGSL